jgi:hypothetical protein
MSIIDSPFDTRKISTKDTIFRITICAICTTINATKACPNKKPTGDVLGCISARWRDASKTLEYDKTSYGMGSAGKHGIKAVAPDNDWNKAKKAWDQSNWGTK